MSCKPTCIEGYPAPEQEIRGSGHRLALRDLRGQPLVVAFVDAELYAADAALRDEAARAFGGAPPPAARCSPRPSPHPRVPA